jgi:hypothetical protein
MSHFKFRWDEGVQDVLERSEWGGSWWYYEIGENGSITRQIILYDNGLRLRYGPDNLGDEYGELLADVSKDEINFSLSTSISAEDFTSMWNSGSWSNGNY